MSQEVKTLPGWQPLLDTFMNKLRQYIQENNLESEFKIMDIKDKWGGLRIYVNFVDDELSKLIYETEIKSFNVCQECGSETNVTNEYIEHWFYTLCDSCRKQKINQFLNSQQ